MKNVKIAINGFGRIGRLAARIILSQSTDHLQLVAINDLTDVHTLAHLLTYDSVHGVFDQTVTASEDAITVGGHTVRVFKEPNPEKLPWGDLDIDIVIESTGRFKDREQLQKQIDAGAKTVVISAPAKGEDIMMVMGVNQDQYNPQQHRIISAASCTTTCLAPVIKVLHETLGVKRALMTTIHSYTNDQVLLDLSHSDLRRARAAGMSMIPTTTGAAQAVAKVIPELKGKLSGMAIRVPTPNVSCVDLVVELAGDTTVEGINHLLKQAATKEMKGIVSVSELPLVSIDFKGSSFASIVDGPSTMVLENNLAKLLIWYDNEWGYSSRLVELISHIAKNQS